MTLRLPDSVLLLATRYTEATGRRWGGVSTDASNDGKTFDRIAAGKVVTVQRCERIIQWFSDNWPADCDWPAQVDRPQERSDAA